MRIDVEKILFVGAKSAKIEFFLRAQKMGLVQFIHKTDRDYILSTTVLDAKRAIKILKGYERHQQQDLNFQKTETAIQSILEFKEQLSVLEGEIKSLEAEIRRIEPLGNFALEPLQELKERGYHTQFFFIKHQRRGKDQIPEELIFVHHLLDLDFYVYFGKDRFHNPKFTEIVIEKPLSVLKKEHKEKKKLYRSVEEKLRNHTAHFQSIEQYLVSELNHMHLEFAHADVDHWIGGEIFSIEAYIPKNQKYLLHNLLAQLAVSYEDVPFEEGDRIPTYLENKGPAKMGEDLVDIYDTPSVFDKDPSMWVLCSFVLFFGMIVSDAGYGVIYLAISLFLLWKLRKGKPTAFRFAKLATVLSMTTIVWGVLIGAYFSIPLSPNSPLNQPSLLFHLAEKKIAFHLQKKDEMYEDWVKSFPEIANTLKPIEAVNASKVVDEGNIKFVILDQSYNAILIEISLLVGIIHLSLSFLRNLYREHASIAWVIIMIGGFMFFPSLVGAVTMIEYLGVMKTEPMYFWGQWLLYGGLALMLLLSLIQHRFSGLAGIFKVIEVFADTLSYLRLYALGLASVILASTCNQLARDAGGGVIGVFILVFGHSINMALGIMAGFIHGLRLNFLEWYHHSFEGGGKKFNPLKLISL